MCLYGIQKCWLTMMTEGSIVVIAQGTVDLDRTMIHNTPISTSHSCFSLDNVIPECGHLMLPEPIEEFNTIASASGCFVL